MRLFKLTDRMNLLQAEGAYQVLSKAQELEKAGKEIIHFEIGQPDFATPSNISRSAIKAIKDGKTKYNPPLGLQELRQVIANYVTKARKVEVSKDMVAVTPSGKTAIFAAMAAVLNEGDEVIYPDPGFPTYEALIDFFGAKRKSVPLLEENSFSFDMKAFSKLFSKKTKVIILNSPSNPTGGVMPKKDLEGITKTIKNTNSWVITDEMYSRILYDGKEYESIYSLSGMKKRTILVDGFSKTYAMTGWRLGYLVMPEHLIEKMDYLLTHMVGCTATFTQYAGIEAFNGPQFGVSLMVKEFEKRRNFIVDQLNKIPGISCQKPEGAFYVFPNIKKFKKSSREIANLILEKGGVALLPGTAFGKYGEGYLRISYATSLENIKKGIERIKKTLRKIV